jgi:hypothetical protein
MGRVERSAEQGNGNVFDNGFGFLLYIALQGDLRWGNTQRKTVRELQGNGRLEASRTHLKLGIHSSNLRKLRHCFGCSAKLHLLRLDRERS